MQTMNTKTTGAFCTVPQRVAPFRVAKGATSSLQSRSLKSVSSSVNSRKTRSILKAVASATSSAPASVQAETPLDIVFVSTEVAPWSKTGGLGDVVGSLPVELAKRGHNVFSIAPRFDQFADAWDTSITMEIDGQNVGFFHTVKQGVHRVWVDHPWFLEKIWGYTGSKLYGSQSGSDYVDNQRRFSLFCKAAIESLTALPFMPGEDAVLVANDWHTALIPVLLKDVYQPAGRFVDTKVAYTIHNVAFQGRFWPETFSELSLPEASRTRFSFEDGYPKIFDENSPAGENPTLDEPAALGQRFAKLNWLRAGITACDKLLTVSPNYAREITSGPQLGVELSDVIAAKGVEGIVNGMDPADWNPALDKFLAFKYNAESIEAGKAYAKAALQRETGLPVKPNTALFGFIGRLEEQKGVDILVAALDKIPAGTDIQVVILGTGKSALEAEVRNVSNRFPGVAVGVVEFNNELAHLITAGSDFMVVPSRFEPCGLIQLHSMSYGTPAVVASTGGLFDTVKEGVTGFQIGALDPDSLTDADADAVATTIVRAAQTYGTPAYAAMRDACISQDLSWAVPARKWEATLTELKFGASVKSETDAQKAAVPTPVAKLDNPAAYPEAPGPKPSEIAAAIAASTKAAAGAASTPTVSPAAAAVAAAMKAATTPAAAAAAPTKPTAGASSTPARAAAVTAAKASVAKTPAPKPAGAAAAAAAKPAAAKPASNGTVAKVSNGAKPAAAPAAAAKPAAAPATPAAAKPAAGSTSANTKA